MAEIVSKKIDTNLKLQIVYFEDKFGAKSQVQHPVTMSKAERDAVEAAHLAELVANEEAVDALMAEEGGQ